MLAGIEFRKSTAKTLASADAVMSILPHVRQQGYGEDNEEQEGGLLCLAVPVFDRFDRVIVAVVSDDAMRRGHEGALRRLAEGSRAGDFRAAGTSSGGGRCRAGDGRSGLSTCR